LIIFCSTALYLAGVVAAGLNVEPMQFDPALKEQKDSIGGRWTSSPFIQAIESAGPRFSWVHTMTPLER